MSRLKSNIIDLRLCIPFKCDNQKDNSDIMKERMHGDMYVLWTTSIFFLSFIRSL